MYPFSFSRVFFGSSQVASQHQDLLPFFGGTEFQAKLCDLPGFCILRRPERGRSMRQKLSPRQGFAAPRSRSKERLSSSFF